MRCFVSACQSLVLQLPWDARGIEVLATALCAFLFKVCRQSPPPSFWKVAVCCKAKTGTTSFVLAVGILDFLRSCMSTVPTNLP